MKKFWILLKDFIESIEKLRTFGRYTDVTIIGFVAVINYEKGVEIGSICV